MERLRAAQGRGTSYGIARLRDGVTLEQARSEMRHLMAEREKEAPRLNTGWSAVLVPVHEQMVEQIRPALLILTGAVLLVLLIACVNVANLLLARSTVRQRELGIRAALGARRRRLLAQLLSESLLLGAAGGVAGLALAFALHRGLLALVADRIPVPRLDQVALDLPMLGVTMAIALATGLLFGFVPAIVTSGSVNESLREGGRHGGGPRSRRILGGLVVAEVAVSLVLLVERGSADSQLRSSAEHRSGVQIRRRAHRARADARHAISHACVRSRASTRTRWRGSARSRVSSRRRASRFFPWRGAAACGLATGAAIGRCLRPEQGPRPM